MSVTTRTPEIIEVELLRAGDRSQPRVVPTGYAALEFTGANETFTYTVTTGTMRRMLEHALSQLDA